MSAARPGVWSRAVELAELTPESRNRYVDFLRALSILAVVFGHFAIAAPYIEGGAAKIAHLLDIAPWTQWLTWLLQVMPIFFFVGGYANGTSWESATRSGTSYGDWLASRITRLFGPVLPLIFVWAAIAAIAHNRGVSPEMIRIGSQVALVPTWFLAVYVLVVLLVPWTHRAWRRLGYGSVAFFGVAALVIDVAFFSGFPILGWVNYLFVWLAVHQLGYAWRDGRLGGFSRGLPLALLGLLALLALVKLGPYPVSLVGVPSDEISNTQPPKLPLLALAALQIGLLLSLERPARRWLARTTPWAVTVLINGMIMTIFLWHSTMMMLLIGVAFWLGGVGLAFEPASIEWWIARPAWIAVFSLGTLPAVLLFARFERPRSSSARGSIAAWRLVIGAVLSCAGLAALALDGVGGGGWLGLRVVPLMLPIVGAAVAGVRPRAR